MEQLSATPGTFDDANDLLESENYGSTFWIVSKRLREERS